MKAVRVLLLIIAVDAMNALGFDQNSFKDSETISVSLEHINSAHHVDGVGQNEFRYEVKMKIWHAEKGLFSGITTEFNLGKSKKVYMYSNEEQSPKLPPVKISAKRLNELYAYYRKYYGADHYEISIELYEIDPVFNDYVTSLTLEDDEKIKDGRTSEGLLIGDEDWSTPYFHSYEADVPTVASGIGIGSNGKAAFYGGTVGTHKETRYISGGGGSKLTTTYKIKID